MQKTRIVIIEDGADLTQDFVTREPVPPLALLPLFVPVGAGRGEWEEAQARIEYIAPGRKAA